MAPGNAIAVVAAAIGVSGATPDEAAAANFKANSPSAGVPSSSEAASDTDSAPPQLSAAAVINDKDVEMNGEADQAMAPVLDAESGVEAAADDVVIDNKDPNSASPQLTPAVVPHKDFEMSEETNNNPIEEAKQEVRTSDDADVAPAVVEKAETDGSTTPDAVAADDVEMKPAPVADAVEEAQQCLICYDELFNKRAVTCVPCMHSMHRTCAILWLESRTDARTQTCCNCRAAVDLIACIETGEELEGVQAYGAAGQPTNALIEGRHYYSQNLAEHLNWEKEEAFLMLSKLAEQQRVARLSGRSESYISDFDDESAKLQQRCMIIAQIEEEWATMRNAQLERDHAAAAAAAAAQAAQQAAFAAAHAAAQAAARAAAAAAAAEAAEVQQALAAVLDELVEGEERGEAEVQQVIADVMDQVMEGEEDAGAEEEAPVLEDESMEQAHAVAGEGIELD